MPSCKFLPPCRVSATDLSASAPSLFYALHPLPLPAHLRSPSSVEDIEVSAASGEISEAMVVAEGEERTTWFVWIIVVCTSISGLLFGAYTSNHTRPQYSAAQGCSFSGRDGG